MEKYKIYSTYEKKFLLKSLILLLLMVPPFPIQWKSRIFSTTIFLQLLFFFNCIMKLNISFSHKHFSNFLRNRSNISFFVRPTDKIEIKNVMSSLDSDKSVGPNSIPSKKLKLLKNYISSRLSEIFNVSFSSGVFCSILKTVKVIPYIRRIPS